MLTPSFFNTILLELIHIKVIDMNKRDQASFKYQTDMANAQRAMNNQMSDYLLAIEVRPLFDEYYSNFRFGYGSNWMKPIFKTYFWWEYFAGYKRGNS